MRQCEGTEKIYESSLQSPSAECSNLCSCIVALLMTPENVFGQTYMNTLS